jgi:hypothetical protein
MHGLISAAVYVLNKPLHRSHSSHGCGRELGCQSIRSALATQESATPGAPTQGAADAVSFAGQRRSR